MWFEGFGEKAKRYENKLREHTQNIAAIRYGFQGHKNENSEQTLRDSIDTVINRTKRRVQSANEPLSAVIQGVDDAWEVCLLKFTIDLVEHSSGGNLGDFRKRGPAVNARAGSAAFRVRGVCLINAPALASARRPGSEPSTP